MTGDRIANIFSYLFHPVFYPPLVLIFYLYSNPIDFGQSTPGEDMILIFQTIITCTLLPLIAIFVMRRLNLISSLQLEDRMERIGPYIVMMIFLIWYYLSVDLYGIAPIYRIFILGGIITLITLFVINLFTKVSLHSAGISGLLTNVILSSSEFNYQMLMIQKDQNYFVMKFSYIIAVIFLILFIVLLSRFYLRKHTIMELMGGVLLGVFGQVFALKLIFIL